MRLPDEPGFPVLPPGQPTRDLLLAQALDACITAERRLPGSAQEIIARQPVWARGDLQRLVGLAGSLDAATSNAIMSSEFRVAARARLMQQIGGDPRPVRASGQGAALGIARLPAASSGSGPRHHPASGRRLAYARRATAGLLAAVLAVAATLTASASALPGEPLYGLKQAQEELAIRLATDDQQRALALLQQANARLDETTRLLQQGRTLDATVTTLRYDQVVQRATMSYVGTIDDTPASAPATVHNMEASLNQDQIQLQALLQSAPEPARADLREALVATERGRALVADPRPVERALGRIDRPESAVAAAIPTMAAEVEASPTAVPTVAAESPTAVATQRPAVVLPTATPAAVVAERHDVETHTDEPSGSAVDASRGSSSRSGTSNASTTSATVVGADQAHGSGQRADDEQISPVVVASGGSEDAPGRALTGVHGDDHSEAVDRSEPAAEITGRAGAAVAQTQTQTDTHGRGEDVAHPIVARPQLETVRSGPAQVVTAPERATAGSSPSSSDHTARDGGGGSGAARVSPTAQVTATRPPVASSSASASVPATSAPTASTGHHGGDGDTAKPASDQKSSASTVPTAHSTGDSHPSTESGH